MAAGALLLSFSLPAQAAFEVRQEFAGLQPDGGADICEGDGAERLWDRSLADAGVIAYSPESGVLATRAAYNLGVVLQLDPESGDAGWTSSVGNEISSILPAKDASIIVGTRAPDNELLRLDSGSGDIEGGKDADDPAAGTSHAERLEVPASLALH